MRSGAGHSGAIPDVDPEVSAEGGRLPAKVGWVGNPEPAYRSGSASALPGDADRSLLLDGQAVRRRPMGFELSRCPSERDGRIPTVLHVPAALPLRADHDGLAPRRRGAREQMATDWGRKRARIRAFATPVSHSWESGSQECERGPAWESLRGQRLAALCDQLGAAPGFPAP